MTVKLTDRLALVLYPHIVIGTPYEEVPVAEAFRRPRYQHLASWAREAAKAALAELRIFDGSLAESVDAVERREPS